MKKNLIGLLAVMAVSSCGMHIEKKAGVSKGGQAGTQNGFQDVSFKTIQSQVLGPHCLRCHSAGGKASNVPFSSYDELMSTGTVKPGNSVGSALFQAIHSGEMPPRQPRLSEDLIQAVAAWIDQGANNN